MSARHPTRRRLQRWLDTGEPRRLSKHIERCSRCQELLDEVSALDEELVADLQAATRPPEDLTERTHGGVDTRLRNEAVFGAFVDLFAVGFDFVRTILDTDRAPGGEPHDDGPAADQSGRGTP